jgi:hypothetical protein
MLVYLKQHSVVELLAGVQHCTAVALWKGSSKGLYCTALPSEGLPVEPAKTEAPQASMKDASFNVKVASGSSLHI